MPPTFGPDFLGTSWDMGLSSVGVLDLPCTSRRHVAPSTDHAGSEHEFTTRTPPVGRDRPVCGINHLALGQGDFPALFTHFPTLFAGDAA